MLAVLAATQAQLNLRAVARLARASPAQVSRVLSDLVHVGLVERREAPPSSLFRFVDAHVAAPLILGLVESPARVLREIGSYAAAVHPAIGGVIVFGSVARGDADIHSDLDVVVVRPGAATDDDEWSLTVEDLRSFAKLLTGNAVAILEVSEADVARKLNSQHPLWKDIARDGVVIHGPSLRRLQQRVVA